MANALALVHDSWKAIFQPVHSQIEAVLKRLDGEETTPPLSQIFAAFEIPLESVKVVIVGQDPYPTEGYATGMAFSVCKGVAPLPGSLRNILKELQSDVGATPPDQGDLTPWCENGVLLLNRVLTTKVGVSNAHGSLGWQEITEHICRELGRRKIVAILWGRSAHELAPLFPLHILGVHPSPLSAHRGFFGSKPFSKVNEILRGAGKAEVDWNL